MNDIKHLISPFALVPPSVPSHEKKATPRPAPPCNCDNSDEENDFGMAPECAFICNALGNKGKPQSKNKSKKRGIKHAKTRTKRNKP